MTLPVNWVNGSLPALSAQNLTTVEQLAQDAHDIAVSASAAAAAAGHGITFNVVTTSLNYTAAANDIVLVNASGGGKTVTIPNAKNAVTVVMKTDSSANIVTVSCAGTINGDATATIVAQWGAGVFVGDGTNVEMFATNSNSGGGGSGSGVSSVSAADSTVTVVGASSVTVKANVGTAAGTVMAGNDTRVTGAAQKSANLADLTNPATARANLGGVPVLPATSTGTKYLRDDGVFATPAGGGGGSGTAAGTSFDPTGTDLTSTDVQDALVELDAAQSSTEAAAVSAVMAAGVVLGPSALPIYTTAARPTSGAAYPFYFDTTTGKLNVWSGSAWVAVGP